MHFKCLLRWDVVCLLIQLSARKQINTYPKCQDFPLSHWGSWCLMPPLFGSLLIFCFHLLPIDGFLTSAHQGLLPFPKQDFLVPGLLGKDDGEWGEKNLLRSSDKRAKRENVHWTMAEHLHLTTRMEHSIRPSRNVAWASVSSLHFGVHAPAFEAALLWSHVAATWSIYYSFTRVICGFSPTNQIIIMLKRQEGPSGFCAASLNIQL